jgi:OPA family glycerol-3-phosphate transporter-like MFS transporter
MGAVVAIGVISDRLQVRRPISIIGAIGVAVLLGWWIPRFGEALPHGLMIFVATLLGCLLATVAVPWAAQYSESLEDLSPALQATGWAFYGLITRGWVAISAPLMVVIAQHYGWGRWMEWSLVAMLFYAIAMILANRRAVTTLTPAQSVAGR